MQSSRGGPVPDTFPSSLGSFSVIPTAALDRVPVWSVFCSGWARVFFSPKHFKSHLIFLDRQRGDNNVGFFPPSTNKASEKPTHYSVFSSGLCYLNLLGGLEEHKTHFPVTPAATGRAVSPCHCPQLSARGMMSPGCWWHTR